MPLIKYPWRARWQVARYRQAPFHVEVSSVASGRRVALHEYPKRDDDYAEDMGRRAKRHIVEGYVIASTFNNFNFIPERDALIAALEQDTADNPGWLQHPLLPGMFVICEHFSVQETREKGGMATFNMSFIEAGQVGDINLGNVNTSQAVGSAAANADATSASQLDGSLGSGPPLAAGSPA